MISAIVGRGDISPEVGGFADDPVVAIVVFIESGSAVFQDRSHIAKLIIGIRERANPARAISGGREPIQRIIAEVGVHGRRGRGARYSQDISVPVVGIGGLIKGRTAVGQGHGLELARAVIRRRMLRAVPGE